MTVLRSFRGRLAVVAALALVFRVAMILTVARRNPDGGDPLWYHLQANQLADGEGFLQPFLLEFEGRREPSAIHPPLYPLVLAVPSLLGAGGFLAHKLTMAVVGAVTVVLVGLIARRLAGDRAGLVAAALAAVVPNLWAPEGILMPEALFACTVVAAILLAYRFADRPGWATAAALGAACGAAALTRSEGILLVPLLVVPLALGSRREAAGWRRPVALAAVGVAAAVAIVAPWTVRNVIRFERPVLLSASGDEVVGYANCDATYSGELLGFWSFPCNEGTPPGDESQRAAAWRREGVDYAWSHTRRVPVVVAARVGRVWGVYRPSQQARLDTIEGRSLGVARAGMAVWAVMLPAAVAGGVVLRRRGVPLWPLAAQAVVVTVTAVYAYGTTRFRIPAEVAAVVLTGVTLDALVRRAGASRAPASP